MTDNEIIKALECKVQNITDSLFRPACNLCVYKYAFLGCNTLELYKDVLDLIKRQQVEIEELREINKSRKEDIPFLIAEVIKEFAKRCIDKSKNGVIYNADMPDYVKEMIGEINEQIIKGDTRKRC